MCIIATFQFVPVSTSKKANFHFNLLLFSVLIHKVPNKLFIYMLVVSYMSRLLSMLFLFICKLFLVLTIWLLNQHVYKKN